MTATILVFTAVAGNASSSGPSMLVTIAAMVGAFSGISAGIVSWRNSKSTASQGYVDQNLASMQAVIATHEAETSRLLVRDVEQRKLITDLEAENKLIKANLARIQRECDDCLMRVQQLEKQP